MRSTTGIGAAYIADPSVISSTSGAAIMGEGESYSTKALALRSAGAGDMSWTTGTTTSGAGARYSTRGLALRGRRQASTIRQGSKPTVGGKRPCPSHATARKPHENTRRTSLVQAPPHPGELQRHIFIELLHHESMRMRLTHCPTRETT